MPLVARDSGTESTGYFRFLMDSSRVNNNWPFAREGLPFILIATILTIFFYGLGLLILTVLSGCLAIFIMFFFRDPRRTCSCPPNAVVTPADGRVIKIQRLEGKENPLDGPAVLISVFMSLFNVHVNRIPITGIIQGIDYHPGKFFSANLDKASEKNERNSIVLETINERRIVVRQIAGLVARRIVCWAKKGDRVQTGQRFGLIRFGSRLDVFLPGDARVIVRDGQRVKAGKTIIGYVS
jgi:phosphatidylserine decarboxylase